MKKVRQASALSYMEPYRVLVVDDVLVNIKVIALILKNIPEVGPIATAESGKKALEALHKEHFDLVFSDIRMPEMSGIEFCDAVRRSKIKKKPIIVGLTADTSESLHQWCASVEMWCVLHKSLSNAQLKLFFESTLHVLKPCDRLQRVEESTVSSDDDDDPDSSNEASPLIKAASTKELDQKSSHSDSSKKFNTKTSSGTAPLFALFQERAVVVSRG